MTFVYERIIRVQDTDATGVLYFANQLQIALEAFEEFMRQSGFSLSKMIEEQKFLLPIVHSEADFYHPLRVGEEAVVALNFTRIGTKSFTHTSEVKKGDCLVGTASIVHAVYCPSKKISLPIPDELRKILNQGE